MFPTLVWTDLAGEVVAATIQPDGPEDALRDLRFVREWLAEPVPDER